METRKKECRDYANFTSKFGRACSKVRVSSESSLATAEWGGGKEGGAGAVQIQGQTSLCKPDTEYTAFLSLGNIH